MELGLLLYWLTFYSALMGWYARTAPIIKNNKSIDFNRYIIPRIILPHVLAGYFLVFIFYSLSLLQENRWVLIFMLLATLAATEYFWIRLAGLRAMIIESITVKVGLLSLGVLIYFYFSAASSTHLELLTKVSPGVFGPFETLLTFVLSSVAWIVLLQLSLTALSVIYMIKVCREDDDYVENLLFVITTALVASFVLVLATDTIFKKAVPYMIDTHFVSSMYHSNEGADNKIICTNRTSKEKIVLLPSGSISIAARNSEEEWFFIVDVCDRK